MFGNFFKKTSEASLSDKNKNAGKSSNTNPDTSRPIKAPTSPSSSSSSSSSDFKRDSDENKKGKYSGISDDWSWERLIYILFYCYFSRKKN
jgi:hypothetical protein